MATENENIGLYLTVYSKPYYTKVLKIVKELEALHDTNIYIYGSFVYSLIKQSYNSEYVEPEHVDLWLETDKSVNTLKCVNPSSQEQVTSHNGIMVKINDIRFKVINNEDKPQYELYINTSGILGNTSDEPIQTVINDIIYS